MYTITNSSGAVKPVYFLYTKTNSSGAVKPVCLPYNKTNSSGTEKPVHQPYTIINSFGCFQFITIKDIRWCSIEMSTHDLNSYTCNRNKINDF